RGRRQRHRRSQRRHGAAGLTRLRPCVPPERHTSPGDGRNGVSRRRARLPTVLVQEGGYHLDSLGGLVTAVLSAY
ncbi:MAG: hypothetical protein M3500_01615, partial [Actinomycetota bacterium]|nr:hypothetical protein [Actinomycetota bacterium]